MFNLLIAYDPETWNSKRFAIDKSRFAEYTSDEIKERYKNFDKKSIDELKTFPTLFAIENEDR